MLEGGVVRQGAEFLVAPSGPTAHLVVHDVNLLEALLQVLVITLDKGQVLVELNDLSVVSVEGSVIIVSLVNLKILQFGSQLLIVFLQGVDLGLTRRDSLEEGCVSLFFSLEPTYHSLHISHTCVCLDLLESLVNAARVLHLFVHLSLHEVVPQLVDVQIVAHLEFSGVLRLVGGSFSNLLVFLLSLDTALH